MNKIRLFILREGGYSETVGFDLGWDREKYSLGRKIFVQQKGKLKAYKVKAIIEIISNDLGTIRNVELIPLLLIPN